MNILDVICAFTYPALFVSFAILAVLAMIDNVNRLTTIERVIFHLTLSLMFAAFAIANPIYHITHIDTARVIVRVLSIVLVFVTFPAVIRNMIETIRVLRRDRCYIDNRKETTE